MTPIVKTSPRAIHHLSCGTMCPHGIARLTSIDGRPGYDHVVCHCLLIEGADGLVLVDTGFGTGDVRRPRQLGLAFGAMLRPRPSAAETAVSQVRELGLDPADVRHVITTHLDLDHAGGLPDFPEAEVHLLGRELEAAMNPGWRERPRYVAAHWSHGPRWVTHEGTGEPWFGFDGVRVLPGSDAEILLIPLIGHSRGHTGVAIRRGEGWLLHCGDSFFHHGEIATPPKYPRLIGAFAAFDEVDAGARRGNVQRLRELAATHGGEIELICSHDPQYLEAARARAAADATAQAPSAG
ncbi:MAG TPA: MBL fold metallo-hydrolase [Solirubrobacteraceae bacterium]|jgi:glyoxylase-like metal-dependent hydrolase (beta-lactamase superfamily II)|nr:MBL fold metallo-hydrolase [Solirubrobacteraceae bacterium]